MKQLFKKIIVLFFLVAFAYNACAQCWVDDLAADLANPQISTGFKNFISNSNDGMEIYETVHKARGANSLFKNDLDLLEKMQSLIQDAVFMERIGGKSGLENLIKANVRARCKSCGCAGANYLKHIDEYLDDVKHIADNYHDVDGFADIISDLKRLNSGGSPNLNMEGSAFLIRVLKQEEALFLNNLSKFEGSIDDLANGCKYDFIFDNNGVISFAEFKSYIQNSVASIFTSPGKYQQFSTYFGKIKSIDELTYFFDAEKISDVTSIKDVFVNGIKNNKSDLFSKMTDELKNSLNVSELSDLTDAKIVELVEEMIILK